MASLRKCEAACKKTGEGLVNWAEDFPGTPTYWRTELGKATLSTLTLLYNEINGKAAINSRQ